MKNTTQLLNTIEVCKDTDKGAKDVDGFGCNVYRKNPGYCRHYDNIDFISNKMCCGCGGGEKIHGKFSINYKKELT